MSEIFKNPLVKKAYDFMKEAHKGQKRADGSDFYQHPKEVVNFLVEHNHKDPILLAAALLHDVVEDTHVTLKQIKEEFGEEIAFLVDGVTDAGRGDGETPIEDKFIRMELSQKKILKFGKKDDRIFLIKTADRIHNLKTMAVLSEDRRLRLAKEANTFHRTIAKKVKQDKFIELIDFLVEDYLD